MPLILLQVSPVIANVYNATTLTKYFLWYNSYFYFQEINHKLMLGLNFFCLYDSLIHGFEYFIIRYCSFFSFGRLESNDLKKI